jgi:hypothetical protein
MAVELIAYEAREPDDWVIEPASRRREWMDHPQNKAATRCLPLTMANHAGWIIRCPVRFKAVWGGKPGPASTMLEFPEQEKLYSSQITRQFGWGIVTFSVPWLFRTSEPYGLLVRGPTNYFVPDIAPLDGVVETNWAPYTFTMNWKITRPRAPVWFRKGDPICMIIPFPLDLLDHVEPRIEPIDANPELRDAFRLWAHTRAMQNQRTAQTGTPTFALDYTRGADTFGEPAREHRSVFKVTPFATPPGSDVKEQRR